MRPNSRAGFWTTACRCGCNSRCTNISGPPPPAPSNLRLGPFAIEDDELKKALSGLTSIVDGLGAFRTHAGSSHGYGQKTYRPPRQARPVGSAQRP
ncbi:abortive infection family protein [bacterium]|nr:abortive infection family protein [bacterium]